MVEPVSIIIPAFNQLDFCRQCVHSLLRNTLPEQYRLILVDNGSTDGVSEFFDAVSGAVVIHSPTNLGFAGGVNLGIKQASGHVLLLNSDTLVPAGWLDTLIRALESASDIGMVGPVSNCVSGSQLIPDLSFDSLEAIDDYANTRATACFGRIREVTRLVGFCLLIRDCVVREVGLFDECYGIGNFEDDDYCVRTLRAGYRLIVAEDAFVFHYGGRTFSAMGIEDTEYQALIDRNCRIFEQKLQPIPEERVDMFHLSRKEADAARAALAAGDVSGALRGCLAAVQACAVYPEAYAALGEVLLALGERGRARETLERALQLDPNHAGAKATLVRLGEL